MTLDLLNEFWRRTEQEDAFKGYSDIKRARPFTLDDEMDEVVGDLAFHEPTNDRVMRRFLASARLPFPMMWIEHGQKGFDRGVIHAPEAPPERTGWLLREIPGDQGGFSAMRISRVMNTNDKVARASSYPLIHVVQPNGGIDYRVFGPEPKGTNTWVDHSLRAMREINRLPAIALAGWNATATEKGDDVDVVMAALQDNPLYGTSALMLDPRYAKKVIEETPGDPVPAIASYVRTASQEQIGELRYLITALALLNEVPVRFVPFKPSGHIRAGGRLKPYMASSIVTLEVPATRRRIRDLREHLKHSGKEAMSKRRHEVRGHWRHADKLPMMHPERWERFEDREGRLRWRTWIPNHARGDASLGWVRQSYEVTRGRGSIPGVKGAMNAA